MAVKIDKGAALGAVSMTPLIDVVFLLLIFFLVASRFAEEDRELDMNLPTAAEAKPLVAEPKELFVNINQSGTFFIGGNMLDIDGVEQVLRQAVQDNPRGQSVIIRADRRSELEAVVQTINLCNKFGVRHRLIATGGRR